jgi:hypothetical protein
LEGSFKTAYNFKNQPGLLVLLLASEHEVTKIEEEMRWLDQLDSLGMKTPKRYKQITFIKKSKSKFKPDVEQHGLVVQKIEGAQDIRLRRRAAYAGSLSKVLNNSKPSGKTNLPCSSSVTRTLVLGCLSNNALAASLVTLSSPIDKRQSTQSYCLY